MSIKVKESTLVKPAVETPKWSLWLSSLDMIVSTPFGHTRMLYIYHPTHNNKTYHPSSVEYFDTAIMKASLSRILVPYYPVAGRLREDKEGRIEIDCNAEGALFIEVETTHELADFGDFAPTDEFRGVVSPTCDYSGGLSSFPLLMLQLTRFKCGGICVCFATHHHVADGISHVQFINAWARLARGLPLTVLPVHDRSTYFAPRHPRNVNFRHLEYEPPLPPKRPLSDVGATPRICAFTLSKEHINVLMLEANSQDVSSYKYSKYEVLAGHVWRSTSRARNLHDDEFLKLYIPTDGRSRFKDRPLPEGYFGNALFFTACVAKVGDIIHKPIWYAASKVHEALQKVENEQYLRSAIDYLESHPDISCLIRGARNSTCPNLTSNSWGRIPLYEANFGWGLPNYVGHGALRNEGQSFFIQTSTGDGSFSLIISMFAEHMTLFPKCFYNYRSVSNL